MTRERSTSRVRVRAPGKLNVFFGVGGAERDGYHEVASVYQAVSVYEDVWAEDADGFSISVTGSVDVSEVPLDDRNLAIRAARMVADAVPRPVGVHLHIEKHVPVAGGMGGGSADAAAALVACDELWGAQLGHTRLHGLAAQLGADVPFALMGGTAVGTGRGDRLNPALARGRIDWVVVPGSGLATRRVYQRLDVLRASDDIVILEPPSVDPAVLHALRLGNAEDLAGHIHNDLERAAINLRPGLAKVLRVGKKSGALAAVVSGSGPTLAFLANSPESAIDLQVSLSAAGFAALHAHGPVPGARVVSGATST